MKAILKKVGEEPKMVEIENTLESLQQAVGGYIETYTLASDLVLICDEDGRVKGKKHNCTVMGVPFCGDIILVGRKRDEFCDVPTTIEVLNKMRFFA